MLAIGLALALARRWHWRARPLQAALVLLGIAAAGALFGLDRSRVALPLAAVAWGALVVAASFAVRALRLAHGGTAASPLAPAAAGAVLAWALMGDPNAMPLAAAQWGVALAAAACGLAALLPRATATHGACRTSLFDCSSGGGRTPPTGAAWPIGRRLQPRPAWCR